jgi:predicted transcriptional regulator
MPKHRHESKVRFDPALYEALKKVADKRGVSFQLAIEEALHIWIELDRRGAKDIGTGMAAAALIMRDEVAAALTSGRPQLKLQALSKQLERWIDQLENAKAGEIAAGMQPPEHGESDPALDYMADLLQQRRPLRPLEQALADHVRSFAQAAHAERWGSGGKRTKG